MMQTTPDATRFFRSLQQLSNRIHSAERVEHIMLDLSEAICDLFQADRMTLYTVNDEGNGIVSRVKTGLLTIREIRLPISASSVAGFVAMSQRLINIRNAHDPEELRRISPDLRFQRGVDLKSGYTTQQLLTAPIVQEQTLFGVLQLINTRHGLAFDALAEDGARELCHTLAVAFKRLQPALGHASPAAPAQAPAPASTRAALSHWQWLLDHQRITPAALAQCLERARQEGLPVEDLLRSEGVALADIGASLSAFFRVPYVGAQPNRLRIEALHAPLKKAFVLEQRWLPLEDSPQGLLVMCVDPEAVQSSHVVRQVFPQAGPIVYQVTTRPEFLQTVEQLYGDRAGPSVDRLLATLQPDDSADEDSDNAALSAAADNELVQLVNKIIRDAYAQEASDIHIEPQPGKGKTRIRFRVEGSLRPYIEVPASYRAALVTRIKIMCDLDISERRKPQDGKIAFQRFDPTLNLELRVATLPSSGGVEDVVLRLLKGGEPIPLQDLNLTPHNLARLRPVIEQPYGLFYVCGPTGSGKTTTLHSILKHLNTPDRKIWTAEDPVEITQSGLRQIQINKKAGIDFATLMRAFLRADPDIIMVGESRDHETVSTGIEASLTGHMVFSTLHTNSAPESIVRLLDMGMDPFNFADALLGVLAQRLTKRLCACKQGHTASDAELEDLAREYAGEWMRTPVWQADPKGQTQALLQAWRAEHGDASGQITLYQAVGCDDCRGSGFKRRLGLHELLVADEHIKKLVQERARVSEITTACLLNGMRTLKMDGIEKVLMGWTDMTQVRAVCSK